MTNEFSVNMVAIKGSDSACPLPPLNPLHYNEERVMIGHKVVPMDHLSEGVFWCRVCGGHPEDPIHNPGYIP